jgi:hypothetical protein
MDPNGSLLLFRSNIIVTNFHTDLFLTVFTSSLTVTKNLLSKSLIFTTKFLKSLNLKRSKLAELVEMLKE